MVHQPSERDKRCYVPPFIIQNDPQRKHQNGWMNMRPFIAEPPAAWSNIEFQDCHSRVKKCENPEPFIAEPTWSNIEFQDCHSRVKKCENPEPFIAEPTWSNIVFHDFHSRVKKCENPEPFIAESTWSNLEFQDCHSRVKKYENPEPFIAEPDFHDRRSRVKRSENPKELTPFDVTPKPAKDIFSSMSHWGADLNERRHQQQHERSFQQPTRYQQCYQKPPAFFHPEPTQNPTVQKDVFENIGEWNSKTMVQREVAPIRIDVRTPTAVATCPPYLANSLESPTTSFTSSDEKNSWKSLEAIMKGMHSRSSSISE